MSKSLNSAISPFGKNTAVIKGKVYKTYPQPTILPQVALFSAEPCSAQINGTEGYPVPVFVPSRTFFSQQGEDLEIFVDFFKDDLVENGTYVEVGAGNGIEFSNTLFFHQSLQWKGLLVEANPTMEYDLLNVRSKDVIVMAAAGEKKGTVPFLKHGTKWAQSHRLDTVTEKTSTMLQRNDDGGKNSVIDVPVEPLGDLLERANLKYVDFLSIDVEGGELEVLKGMNWDIPVHVVLIECISIDCDTTLQRIEQTRQILRDNGFVFHKDVGDNEIWHNPEYSRPSDDESNVDTEQTIQVPA